MKNSIAILFILLTSSFCIGCEVKKKNGHDQILEYVKYHSIVEKDFSFWDGLVEENDLTYGPQGNACEQNIILTAEAAAMVGEALIRSSLNDTYMEECPKIVISKCKYWVVQGIASSTKEDTFYVFIAVIQKSNGKILEFKVLEK